MRQGLPYGVSLRLCLVAYPVPKKETAKGGKKEMKTIKTKLSNLKIQNCLDSASDATNWQVWKSETDDGRDIKARLTKTYIDDLGLRQILIEAEALILIDKKTHEIMIFAPRFYTEFADFGLIETVAKEHLKSFKKTIEIFERNLGDIESL